MAFPKLSVNQLIERYLQDEVYYETEGSAISKFFEGKSVFLTGGTGFLGKLLVEKLLRASPNIGTIFLLIRPKKGKDKLARADEIFKNQLYEKLSKLKPNFKEKINLIDGELTRPCLGMCDEDRKRVTETVSIIIHSAATVKFNERLTLAVNINIRGTKEMLTLAKECRNLLSFVHVSTAYSNTRGNITNIEEKFYDVPYSPENLMDICDVLPAALVDELTPRLLGEWRNTYTFTKAAAEEYVRKHSSDLPVCVVRPAIVIATYKEPIKSWIDNVYGETGIVIGTGMGILKAVYTDKEGIANIVPGDMTINSLIAAAYKTATERNGKIPIYNFTVSEQNKLTWEKHMNIHMFYGQETPFAKSMGKAVLLLIKNLYIYYIAAFFLHTVPGYLLDVGLLLSGKRPMFIYTYGKFEEVRDSFMYFTRPIWHFHSENTQNLYKSLSEVDKKLFFFDMKQINWIEYISVHIIGLRTFLTNSTLDDIPQARRRYFMLTIIHYTIKYVVIGILLILLYSIISYIFF